MKVSQYFTGKLKSLFNRVAGLQLCQKETLTQMFFQKYCENFNSTLFEQHLRTAASVKNLINGKFKLQLSLRKLKTVFFTLLRSFFTWKISILALHVTQFLKIPKLWSVSKLCVFLDVTSNKVWCFSLLSFSLCSKCYGYYG